MIQLFAFVRGLEDLPEGEDLRALPIGDLTAVVGPALDDGQDDLVRHGLLLQALADSADAVLPARFGERFADATALTAAVAERIDELERQLAAVEGCVELAVRVSRAQETPREPDGGAYMRSRLRAVAADEAAADALHALLRQRARAAVVAQPTLSQLLHDACYLVERDRIDEFVSSVESYAASHPDLSLVCTGPWAPASFAGAA